MDIPDVRDRTEEVTEHDAEHGPTFHQVLAHLNGMATCEVDQEGRILWMNTVMPNLLELRPERPAPRFLELVTLENRKRLARVLHDPPEHPVRLRKVRLRCGGRTMPADITLVPTGEGKRGGLFVVVHEHGQQHLLVDHAYVYREVLRLVGDAVIMTDPFGAIVYWNRGAARMFGWDRKDVLGAQVQRLLFIEDDPDAQDLTNSLLSGRTWTGDCLVRSKDGSVLLADVQGGPIIGKYRRPIGMYVVCRDRTHEFQVREIGRKKTRIMPDGERMQKDYVDRRRVVHQGTQEVKNPLTAMRLQLDLLRSVIPVGSSSRADRSMKILKRNLDRTNRLLDRILDASLLERHRLELDPTPRSLHDLLHDLHHTLRDTIAKTGVRLVLDVDPDIEVYADVQRIDQALTAIIKNGMQYNKPGGFVKVTARVRRDETEIQIEDDGAGLARDDLDHIFDPFPPIRKKERNGTGLSLYITKGIIDAHHGTIDCDSPGPGRGVRFTIRLPNRTSVHAIIPPNRPDP